MQARICVMRWGRLTLLTLLGLLVDIIFGCGNKPPPSNVEFKYKGCCGEVRFRLGAASIGRCYSGLWGTYSLNAYAFLASNSQ